MNVLNTLEIDDAGTCLAYLDSGSPHQGSGNYTTVFALHGIIFTSPIFQKVIDLAPEWGIRFVAINRRDYPVSSPLSPEQIGSMTGTEEAQKDFLCERGQDYLHFLDRFISLNALPPASDDGKSGGIALLGWSLGCSFSATTIAHIDTLDTEVQKRLGKYLRRHILLDPPYVAFGLPNVLAQTWFPWNDESIPLEERIPVATEWLTGYFDHGDITKRDPERLSHCTKSTAFIPSLFAMDPKVSGAHPSHIDILNPEGFPPSDRLMLTSISKLLHRAYLKACFEPRTRDVLPHLRTRHIVGNMSGTFAILAYWAVWDDNEANRGDIEFLVMPETNHFPHWDQPQGMMKVLTRVLL